MSTIIARLRRLRRLAQAALTPPKSKPLATPPWRFSAPPTPRPSIWNGVPALQPARSRGR